MNRDARCAALIQRLTLAPGLPGFEDDIAAIFSEELEGVCRSAPIVRDGIGNTLCYIHPAPGFGLEQGPERAGKQGLKIVLAAHMDEIGFIVSGIEPNGFIRIHNLGGWNPVTLPSSPMEVLTASGSRVPGILGHISPHFLKDRRSEVPEISELFLDIGAISAAEAAETFSVVLGDPVVPVTSWHYSPETGCMMSKAFDDRIGVAALVEVGRRLAERSDLENHICLAATVQEEVGTRGARVLSNYCRADIAIIIEGAPADDVPGGPAQPQTALRGGAHVRIFDPTMLPDRELLRQLRDIAAKHSIRIQETVRRGGGTDGQELHLAGRGIPSIVTGVPVRYAHSHNCLASLDDFHQLVDLLTAFCLDAALPP